MSLHVYFDGVDVPADAKIERDVEHLFHITETDGCEYDRLILRRVEKGEYVDDFGYLSRFGVQLLRKDMSTGSKAALSVYHNPGVVVWCGEVGCNALTEIVRNCRRGSIIVPSFGCCILRDIGDIEIDVVCAGKHYTSLDKFSRYMMEDVPPC